MAVAGFPKRSPAYGFCARICLLACLALLSQPALAADQVGALAVQINAAHKAKQYKAMEADLDRFLELRPGSPRGIYLMAVARANRGDKQGVIVALGRLADMGLYFDIRKQADFVSLQNTAEFASLERRFAANLQPAGHVQAAFQVRQKAFLPEGIAHDPASGDFFVSSVHLRKIVRVHAGQAGTFANRADGLWGVFGMRVDAERGALWAASAALPQAQGFAAGDNGDTALFRFDLHSGAVLAKYPAPDDGAAHQFNDVAVASDGTVYVADANGGVFVLKPGAGALEPMIPSGELHSSQGMALSADGSHLYVSDYGGGLYAYDLQARRLVRIRVPSNVCVYGIDGLVRHGKDLFATQNGVQPERIVRYKLDDTGLAIRSAEVLVANDKQVPEPTLLTVAGDALYVVANGQWTDFDEQGRVKAGAVLQAPRIVKLPLH